MKSTAGTRGKFLRFKADRGPVVFVTLMFAVHAAIFLLASPLVAAFCILPVVAVSSSVASLNHHHQHVNTFHSRLFNRMYEIALSLQTGISPFGWVLHHNLGHHLNYLNQPPHERPDESHWTRADGSTMGRLEYTIHLFWHHPFDIYQVGKSFPNQWRSFLLMKIPLYAISLVGLAIDPLMYTLAFLIPGILTLFHTCWATYEHHADQRPTGHYDASVNREDKFFNWITCNLGLHTAHHLKPGVHWSLLPKLHAEIREKIPAHQLLKNFW